jgi:hypothetical protein
MIMTIEDWEMKAVVVAKEQALVRGRLQYWSTKEEHNWKYLLELEERGIGSSEFFEGRKASIFSVRGTHFNNKRIERLLTSFRIVS